MSLYQEPPEAIVVEGVEYPVNTDFRTWISFQGILTGQRIPGRKSFGSGEAEVGKVRLKGPAGFRIRSCSAQRRLLSAACGDRACCLQGAFQHPGQILFTHQLRVVGGNRFDHRAERFFPESMQKCRTAGCVVDTCLCTPQNVLKGRTVLAEIVE